MDYLLNLLKTILLYLFK